MLHIEIATVFGRNARLLLDHFTTHLLIALVLSMIKMQKNCTR